MLIPPRRLVAFGICEDVAALFAEPLSAACTLHHINTPLRIAALVAQCAHESAFFTRLQEDLFYRDAERVARLFRTAFDLDRDRRISASEIEAARPYLRNPEKLANRVYAGRYGNGNEASGDGWRYRGRGLIGTTFRDNYMAAQVATGRPYVEQPDLLARPSDACLTAAFYFASRGCCSAADLGDIDGVTRRINPGMAGAEERRANFSIAVRAFSC